MRRADAMRGSRAGAVSRALLVLAVILLPLLPATALGQSKSAASRDDPKPAARGDTQVEPARQPARHGDDKPAQAEAQAAPGDFIAKPLKVPICQAVERDVSDYEDVSGIVGPIEFVQIRARASGYLLSVKSRPGQIVKEGDTLFQIDSRSYRLELDKAEAELRRAQSRVKPLSAQLAQARAANQGSRAKLEADLEEAEAAIQAAKAARELAQLNLEYTRVTAPFTGKISAPLVATGDVVVADKTELATLTKNDPLSVQFVVTEATFLRLNRLKREGKRKSGLEVGLAVDVVFAGDQNLKLKGKMYSVAGQVSALAGGINCAAIIPNADGVLLPGLSASVRLITSEAHRSVLVPGSAILRIPFPEKEAQSGPLYLVPSVIGQEPAPEPLHVLVVTDRNVFDLREVHAGLAYDNSQVVVDRLKAGEWVVIDPEPLRPYSLRTVKIDFEPAPFPVPGRGKRNWRRVDPVYAVLSGGPAESRANSPAGL